MQYRSSPCRPKLVQVFPGERGMGAFLFDLGCGNGNRNARLPRDASVNGSNVSRKHSTVRFWRTAQSVRSGSRQYGNLDRAVMRRCSIVTNGRSSESLEVVDPSAQLHSTKSGKSQSRVVSRSTLIFCGSLFLGVDIF